MSFRPGCGTVFFEMIFFGDNTPLLQLFPVCNKNIGVSRPTIVSVTAPNEFLTIGRKHWKRVELLVKCDLFQFISLVINHENVEWKSDLALMVATE